MATNSPEADASLASAQTLPDIVLAFLRGWDRFWFRPADPTTLGLIRLCVGLTAIYVHLCYTPDLYLLFGKDAWVNLKTANALHREAPVLVPPLDWNIPQSQLARDPEELAQINKYYRTWGVDPRLAYTHGTAIWSIWYLVTDPTWMMVIHLTILGIMVLFTAGFCTRITSVLTWLGAMCYIQRAPTTLFGMDTMMMILLLYLMIAPCGAALSVDRLLGHWWETWRARRAHRPLPVWGPPAPRVTANFALRLIQVHFCVIYLASGTSKLQGAAWWNGTALWGTLANYEFAPLNYARYENFLAFLAAHRPLWEMVMAGGVFFTLLLEIGLPFLIWVRQTRWLMIIGAVGLHVGIALSMGLTTFGLFMLCMVLAFIPGQVLRRILGLAPALPKPAPWPAAAAEPAPA